MWVTISSTVGNVSEQGPSSGHLMFPLSSYSSTTSGTEMSLRFFLTFPWLVRVPFEEEEDAYDYVRMITLL